MRMMLKVTIPSDTGSQAIQDGTLQKVIDQTMAKASPEAAYFTIADGQRCAYFFFQMNDVTDLPSLTEPMWINLDADVEVVPVMNPEDLQTALQKAFA